jgi:hypothetical protein
MVHIEWLQKGYGPFVVYIEWDGPIRTVTTGSSWHISIEEPKIVPIVTNL